MESFVDELRTIKDKATEVVGGEPEERNPGITPAENAMAFAVALGATLLTKQVLQAGWRKTLNEEPPKNPASSDVDWSDALLWGAVSGAIVGMARIASRRASTSAYRSFRS